MNNSFINIYNTNFSNLMYDWWVQLLYFFDIGLARRVNAKILIASTSEIYGDPEMHPQSETYWGHVNPIGTSSSLKQNPWKEFR